MRQHLLQPAKLLFLLCFCALCAEGTATAQQSQQTSREEFQSAYKTELKTSPNLFADAPIYHIVPDENNITFAAAGNYTDVTIGPEGTDTQAKRTNLAERLDYKGWSGSPYLAFSGKHFALGITGEVGSYKSHYLRQPNEGFTEQDSTLRYSGVGMFVYYSPTLTFLPKNIVPTLLAGGDNLNAQQSESGTLYSPTQTATMQNYRYSVQSYTGGLNIGIRFAKRFTFIPFLDYKSNVVKAPTLADGNANGLPNTDPSLQDNVNLYWHTQPNLTYGLDFAVKIGSFDIHLGGLFGLLGSLNKGNDRIQDNSQSLTFAFDMKGD